ncbi:TGS domain-containing protein [Chloroflexota bacterium]
MLRFENIQIQLVDVPAITTPHVDSWLPNILRNADILLIVVELTQEPVAQMKAIIERLEKFRITLFDKAVGGELGMVWKRALLLGNKGDLEGAERGYKSLHSQYGEEFPLSYVSAKERTGLEQLGENIYKALDIIRVYTKAPGGKADLTDPTVVKKGSTVKEVAEYVHKDFRKQLKYAQVWGSGKFDGQKVKREYVLQEGDMIELHV